MKKQFAFTLLEAVIALAIFAMGATALYGWINTNLITLARVDQINQRSSSVESAIEFMSMIDPEVRAEGSDQIGDLQIRWQTSTPLYKGDVLDEQNQKTINQATIYPATVILIRNGKTIYQFQMSLLGVKKVRDLNDVIFN
ncbi:MAG: prepilin-type N-terminal cleavage/methylation domain-containing protein [Cellvibrio sp.]|uniref:PulJ/GspJ family protein n=1 Tax=Cellvibrio sp. TaxID=1965322 RepID=UPI0031A3A553